MRRSRDRKDRDRLEDVFPAMRRAMSLFDTLHRSKVVHWSPSDWQVLHTLLRHIGTYTRLWDAMSIKELSRLSGSPRAHVRQVDEEARRVERDRVGARRRSGLVGGLPAHERGAATLDRPSASSGRSAGRRP